MKNSCILLLRSIFLSKLSIVTQSILLAIMLTGLRNIHTENALPFILKLTDSFYDFAVPIIVNYFNQTGRQTIVCCLYNHSHFFKMCLHNTWLLGRSELIVDLPEDFFISPLHLFLFCGNLLLSELMDDDDLSSFDFHSFQFA